MFYRSKSKLGDFSSWPLMAACEKLGALRSAQFIFPSIEGSRKYLGESGVPVVRWQGCSPEKCKSSRLKTCAVHVISVNRSPRSREKIGTGYNRHQSTAHYLATARPYCAWLLSGPLLAIRFSLTAVPFCFFDVFDPCGAKAKKNKTTAEVSAGLRPPPDTAKPLRFASFPLGRLDGGTRSGRRANSVG